MRRYSVNDEFFSAQLPLPCYWAGFIAADGSVHRRSGSPRLVVKLATKDKIHVECLKRDLDYDGPLHELAPSVHVSKGVVIRSTGSITLMITSACLCENLLANFNIVPNKSLIAKPPSIESQTCRFAFVAGLIDGDGTITWDKREDRRFLIFSLLGTREVLCWVLSVYKEILGAKTIRVQPIPKGNIYKLTMTGSQAATIYATLVTLREVGIPLLERKWSLTQADIDGQHVQAQNHPKNKNKNAPEGMSYCHKCKLFLSKTAFVTNRRAWNGLQAKCKNCLNAYKREQRQLRKREENHATVGQAN